MRGRFFLVALILLNALLQAGCGQQAAPPTPAPPVPSPPVQEKPLPEAIQGWIEDSRTIFLAQTKELDGTLYLLVSYGK